MRHTSIAALLLVAATMTVVAAPAYAQGDRRTPQKPPMIVFKPQTTIRSQDAIAGGQIGMHLGRALVFSSKEVNRPESATNSASQAKGVLSVALNITNSVLDSSTKASPTLHDSVLIAIGKVRTLIAGKSDAVKHGYELGLALGEARESSTLGESSRALVRARVAGAQTHSAALNLEADALGSLLTAIDQKLPMTAVHDQIVVLLGQWKIQP